MPNTLKKIVRAGDRLGKSSARPGQGQSTEPAAHRLELGTAGRKPIGSDKTKFAGRKRWGTRRLAGFPAQGRVRHTPWEPLIKTVLRLERSVCKRNPATGLCT